MIGYDQSITQFIEMPRTAGVANLRVFASSRETSIISREDAKTQRVEGLA